MGTTGTAQAGNHEDTNQKVVVCKYTGTPGTAETYHHFTETNVNSMPADWVPGTFPYAWTEAQGNSEGSYAIGYAGIVDGTSCPGYSDDESGLLPTPPAPTLQPADCDTNGSLTLSPVDKVVVSVTGPGVSETLTAAKTYTSPGTYTVTYTAVDPNFFKNPGKTDVVSYSSTVQEATGDCPLKVPAFPAPTAADCDTDGSLKVTPAENVTVTVAFGSGPAETVTQDKTYTAPGTYKITYQAREGLVFEGGKTTVSADVMVAAATGGCPPPGGPGTPPMPDKPDVVVVSDMDVVKDCAAETLTTTTTTTTTDWVFDQSAWKWVLGLPTSSVAATSRPTTASECPIEVQPVETEKPIPTQPTAKPVDRPDEVKGEVGEKPRVAPVVADRPEALPTAVDAGFGPVAAAPQDSPLGQGLVGGGLLMLLLAGSMQMGRRERGAHEA